MYTHFIKIRNVNLVVNHFVMHSSQKDKIKFNILMNFSINIYLSCCNLHSQIVSKYNPISTIESIGMITQPLHFFKNSKNLL